MAVTRKVLLADASKTFHSLFRAALGTDAFELLVCSTGQEALDLIANQYVDFVCSGFHLPDMEGIELCRHVRHLTQYARKPFVLLTSVDSADALAQTLPAGVTDIFHKNDVEHLLAFIRRFTSAQAPVDGKILYVEDNASQRLHLTALLEQKGLQVEAFSSADAAWAQFLQRDYDIVLTDIVLDGTMSGLAFVNRIRRQLGTKGDTPILALTAFDDATRRVELFNLGVTDYITKPVAEEELFVRIRGLLEVRRLSAALAREQQQRHADTLAQTESRLQAVFDVSPEPVLISNESGVIVSANHMVEDVFGYSTSEIIGRSIEDLIPPRYRDEHPTHRHDFGVQPSARQMGYGRAIKALRKDGTELDVELSLSRIRTSQGALFASAVRNISEQKLAEARLRVAAVAFESQEGMVVTDVGNVIIQINRAFTEITGYTADDVVGRDMNILKSGRHDADFYTGMWDKIVREGSWSGEIWNRRKNGAIHPHWLTITAVNDSAGATTSYLGTYTDITERMQAEGALRASHRILTSILETTRDGYWRIGRDGILADANLAYCRQSGYALEDLIGMQVSDLEAKENAAETAAHLRLVMASGSDQFETRHRRKDGSVWDVEVSATFSKEEGGYFVAFMRDISDRKRTAELIAQRENYMHAIIENEPECIKIIDAAGRLKQMNRAGLEMIEADAPEQVVGQTLLSLVAPEYRQAYAELHQQVLAGEKRKLRFELVGFKGRRCWLETHAVPLEVDGEIVQLAVTRDITLYKQAEAELRVAAAAFESQEAMVITDANSIILRVNRAFTAITGYAPEEVVGENPRILKSSRHSPDFYRAMWESIIRTGGWQGEVWDKRKNGEEYPKWLTISAVRDFKGKVTHYIGAHFDITERKKAEEKIAALAFFDSLTGLPNRYSLHERLAQSLGLAGRNEKQLALMLIDLDNFKTINDTLGHQVGDQLLMQVAQRLTGSVRQSDLVARLGGDEFVVVLPDIDSPADAAHVADKILSAVSEPYLIEGQELRSSPSIGICLYPDDASEAQDLIKKADAAMYHAKARGKRNYQFFKEEIQTAATRRLSIESDLRRALAGQQFVLHYQPQLDLRSGRLVGVEALIRWQHPERGLVPPLDFVPIAEETGLIEPIGDWVLQESCRQLAQWRQMGIEHIRISVNLSPSQFLDRGLPDRIQALMRQYGLSSTALDLELTESMTMASPKDTIASMSELKRNGLSLSIDDFGTGYSSLAYLKMFPISTLKIDRSFVKDIETDQNDADICDVTVLLAHKLGMDVVAEGVETEAQLKYLLSIGCEKVQGYLISKPLPAAQAAEFIRQHRAPSVLGTVDLWADSSAAQSGRT